MRYVGIDVSSKKLNIHILDHAPLDFEIENTDEAILEFIKVNLKNKKQCVVGCESTGRLHLSLQSIFVKLGFDFKVLNPILTNKKIALSIRKKKTDCSDAKLIAQLLSDGQGQQINLQNLDKTKRTILRTRSQLVKQRSSLKLILNDLKKDKESQLDQTIDTISNLIKYLDQTIEQIHDSAIKDLPQNDDEKLIRSIPGFALTLSAVVSSEVGDFNRFPTAKQFKAYVGIDPKVSQSGNNSYTGKITKRGNSNLRYAFYMAAQVARQYDPDIKEFFEKKIEQGKPYRVAMVATARKLCERVYAVVKRGIPYTVKKDPQLAVA